LFVCVDGEGFHGWGLGTGDWGLGTKDWGLVLIYLVPSP
jgi:hypothetical protein